MVRIDPYAAARLLPVSVDAPRYYASTDRQLDGAQAPIADLFTWHDLPAGHYTIRATLQSASLRETQVTRTMVVMGKSEPEGTVGRRPRP